MIIEADNIRKKTCNSQVTNASVLNAACSFNMLKSLAKLSVITSMQHCVEGPDLRVGYITFSLSDVFAYQQLKLCACISLNAKDNCSLYKTVFKLLYHFNYYSKLTSRRVYCLHYSSLSVNCVSYY